MTWNVTHTLAILMEVIAPGQLLILGADVHLQNNVQESLEMEGVIHNVTLLIACLMAEIVNGVCKDVKRNRTAGNKNYHHSNMN